MTEGPTEREIEQAIEAIQDSKGKFEHLAVRWASLAYGERFSGIVPQGHRADHVTVSGWPDGFVSRPDGSRDAVSATTAKDWRGHLRRDDLPHIEAQNISGFVFVVWANQPSQEEEERLTAEIASCGLPKGKIDLVFKRRLVSSLAQQPRFAKILHEVLRLPISARPFRLIDAETGLAELGPGRDVLHPRSREFVEGHVHEPAALAVAMDRLASDRFVEVKGRGAAGKTVLAEHIAHRHLGPDPVKNSRAAYYMQLSSQQDGAVLGNLAETVLTSRADEGVLFIVDDIHLNPELALDLMRRWKEHGAGSLMVQLGRSQTAGVNRDADALAVVLSVERADLIGVYRRLARVMRNVSDPPAVPPEVLKEWMALFRGDLVLFSFAVAGRIDRLLSETWHLTEEDAAERARERYLTGLGEEERLDLMRLARIAAHELAAPLGIIGSGLPSSRQRGAVIDVADRDGIARACRLAHPGMGRLLLAGDFGPPPWQELIDWAARDPSFALTLAMHRLSAGDTDFVERSLPATLDSSDRFVGALFAISPRNMRMVFDTIDALEVIEPARIDAIVHEQYEQIVERLVESVGGLGTKLEILQQRAPSAARLVLSCLTEDAQLDAILRQLATSHSATAILDRLEGTAPELADALATRLADETVLLRFLDDLQNPLSFLASKGVERLLSRRGGLIEVVADLLDRDSDRAGSYVIRAVQGSPAAFVEIYAAAHSWLPLVARLLDEQLADPAALSAVAAAIAKFPATQLIGAAKTAIETGPLLSEAIASSIAEGQEARLVRELVAEPSLVRGFQNASTVFPPFARLADMALQEGAEPDRASPENRLREELTANPAGALVSDPITVMNVLADPTMPSTTVDRVVKILTDPENRETATASVLQLSPEHLGSFLRWSRKRTPSLHAALLETMRDEAGRDTVASLCVESTLEHVASLLNVLDKIDPEAAASIENALKQPSWLARLNDAAFRSAPSGWVAIMRRRDLAEVFMGKVDVRRWRHYWRARPPEEPNWMYMIAKQAHQLGRDDLRNAPAEQVLSKSTSSHWKHSNPGLPQLNAVLWHGADLGEESVLGFLDRAISKSWLDDNYARSRALSVGIFLNSVSVHHSSAVLQKVLTPGVERRLKLEAGRGWNGLNPNDARGLLILIGSCAQLGISAAISLPPTDLLTRALAELFSPTGTLTKYHSLAWIGLRSIIAVNGAAARIVDPHTLEAHLPLWRSADPEDSRIERVNAWMIEWMEQAAQNGGTLLPDEEPVAKTIPALIADLSPERPDRREDRAGA